uniref:Uncharacterized protein n=1 Tax=Tanacetum cinerariifolium TaxID=118510 RepID=A0A699ICS7_TANCI|nr:hypothetical protein [Tanacetum cinerariifolium]
MAKLHNLANTQEGGEEPVMPTRTPWLSVLDYFNVDGGIVTGCFGDVKKFLKNWKLEKVVTVIKSCTPNALADLTVTVKDLSRTIYDTIHYKVLTKREKYGQSIPQGWWVYIVSMLFLECCKEYLLTLSAISANLLEVNSSSSIMAGSPLSPTTSIFLVIKISRLNPPFLGEYHINGNVLWLGGSIPYTLGLWKSLTKLTPLPDLEWLQLACLSSAWFFGLKNTDRTESIDTIVNTSFMPSKRSPINRILAKGNVLPGMLKIGTLQKYDLKLDVTDLYLKGLTIRKPSDMKLEVAFLD